MEKQTKKWWLITTANEEVIEVSDDYYNHGQLFEASKPFWGTQSELVQHLKEHWFTQNEIAFLKKGWQAYQKIALAVNGSSRELHWRWRGTFKEQQTDNRDVIWRYELKGYDIHVPWHHQDGIEHIDRAELETAPWFKHYVVVDVSNVQICLSFEEKYGRSWKDAPWTKILQITCLDQDGSLNQDMAKSVIVEVGNFIAELQSTIK